MIDHGSSANILFKSTLEWMNLSIRDLEPCEKLLYGFTGNGMAPTGSIRLPLTVGMAPKSNRVMALFIVIDIPSLYNAMIGRPALYDLRAVTLVFHLLVKFPTRAGPVKELEEVSLDPKHPTKVVKLGKEFSKNIRFALIQFLWNNQDLFVWSHDDMVGINPAVISHALNIDTEHFKLVQKMRLLNPTREIALKEEVEKIRNNNFIREAFYPLWVSNPVLVQKPNNKWRVCIDFIDLNKACPKDYFPLLRIDHLVDSTAGHEILNFMDAYLGYNRLACIHPTRSTPTFAQMWGCTAIELCHSA
ncbi:uncharacterized protein LOC133814122 [Humulus lupulus]|uniref:uncharacterized protein LOC133814122 n=1 Tax=Humulus lupulus TaxID=3486 RepID=UPI002B412926|nr:uncharacterized protein LOC133814122 [Humulus lupulus]